MNLSMVDKIREQIKSLPHPVRWAVVLVLGGAFLLAGIVMLVLPGPGIVFIGIGFAILAIEFTWAEVVLHRATTHGRRLISQTKERTLKVFGRNRDASPPSENGTTNE